MAPTRQGLDVSFCGGTLPHLRVHGRGPEDPLRAGEDRGREQVVPEPDGGPRHRVRGRWGYEDDVCPAGEGDVLDAARTLPPGLVGVDVVSCRDGERLFGDEAERCFGGDDPDLVLRLSEAPDHPRRLVRRDATRYPDEYAGHAGSIQRVGEVPSPTRAGQQVSTSACCLLTGDGMMDRREASQLSAQGEETSQV